MLEAVKRQTEILFKMIEETLISSDIQFLSEKSGGFRHDKQFYHMLVSLDYWFIDPRSYDRKEYSDRELKDLEVETDRIISRDQLIHLFNEIRERIFNWLKTITVDDLNNNITGSRLTHGDLILAQFRHVMYHIGYLHCCLMNQYGRLPRWIGITKDWED
jgi:hypothetical protein